MFEMKFVQMKNTTTASAILFYRHMQPCVDASGALCPGEWSDWKPVPTELVSYEVFTAIKIPFMRSNAGIKARPEGASALNDQLGCIFPKEIGMNTKDDGGPAFPAPTQVDDWLTGMTLRDYFAAKAMQGFIANPASVGRLNPVDLSAAAYGAADAMLEARNAT